MKQALVTFLLLLSFLVSAQDSILQVEEDISYTESDSTQTEEFDYTGRPASFSKDSVSGLYQNEGLQKTTFDPAVYKKAVQGLDYKEKKEKPEEKETAYTTPDLSSGKSSFLGIGQVILIILILLLLILLIYLIVRSSGKGNPTVKEDPEWLQVDIEKEQSPEEILQRKLDECLAQGNYAFAVRLLYLQSLADLHRVKLIRWKKDKTNADYVAELRNTPFHKRFRDLTRWFEKSWYSTTPPDEASYRRLEPLFKAFRNEVGLVKKGGPNE